MSAINAAINTNRIFFIPTALVYNAMVYNVVSVDPIIVDAINPIRLSTPFFDIISVATAIDALPDIGRNNASGIISAGILNVSIIGFIMFIISSINPELLSAPTAKNIPTNVGNIFTTTCIPSFAPSINVSYTLFFSITPYVIINKITIGTAIVDK